jgi:MYXO-CTERM domain-containing protein
MLSKLLSILRSALVCTLSLLATASLAQTTIHVGPGQAYTTIQSGVNAANNGDTVLVAPGTYNENINFNGKAITVTSSGGPAVTTISGPNETAAVILMNGETRSSVLSNFTITAGGQYYLNLMGGIYISASSPTILNNVITKATCYGISAMYSSPLIQGNEISYVQAQPYECSFASGAGIWLYSQLGGITPVVIGNTIENNTESGLEDAGGNGGAGIAIWAATPVIQSNIIRNNATGKYESPAGGGEGGGIFFWGGASGLIANNLISGNTSNLDGGGISFSGTLDSASNLIMVNNTIVDNSVVPVSTYTQNVLGGQQFYFNAGPGSSVTFSNNIISGSTTDASVVCSDGADSLITFQNNDFYNTAGPTTTADSTGTCTYPAGTSGNISADPMFSSATTASYHPQPSSPVVDTGDNKALQLATPYGASLSTDLDGTPRVQDATGKGCIIDMGAYEYPGTVNDCGTTETLTSSLNPATAGQTVTFKAQLSSTTGTPTGTIQFLDGANPLSTQTVSSSGSATFSTNSLTVGSHTITANYQPTGTFGASTASLTQVINGYATSTALTCLPNPVIYSYPTQFTATVTSASGTPTGSVSFTDNGGSLGTQALLNGSAGFADTLSSVGTHDIVATYTPTGSFAASSATCSEVVDAFPTTSVLTVAPTTSTYGSPVTLTAIVSPSRAPAPGTPTGVVTFFNGASSVGTGTLVGGVATLSPSTLPGGNYHLTCTYGGSTIYASSTCNSVPVVITPALTALALTSSLNPAPYLSTITFTARLTVNGKSAGAGNMIRLSVNGQTISLMTDATGSATYTISTLQPNSYPVTANFAATNNLLASSASLTQVITALSTSVSLTASPNPGDLNQPVTITATVASPATSTQVGSGKVTFYDGDTSLGSAQVTANGTTSLTKSFTTVGVHDLTAVYAGDADFTGSTSAVLKEAIQAGDFSISVLPAAATLYTGKAAAAKVSISSLQGFNQPLALTCTGLPANTTCSFTPASLPEGQGTAKLVIQTSAPHQASSVSTSAAVLGALSLLLLPGWRRRRHFLAGFSLILLAVAAAMGMAACGSPNPITGGTPPGAYKVAVTATTAGAGPALTHAAVFTLTVKSLF